MNTTAVPEFFERFPMRRAGSGDLDAAFGEDANALTILFLWGRDCPNCDVAKRAMLVARGRFEWPDVRWLQANVYDDPALGTRFGLHGVPAFLVFRGSRRIGRITPWPGTDAFVQAIERQRASGAA